MKIAVTENEAVHTRYLQEQLQKWSKEYQISYDAAEFISGEDLLSSQFLAFDLIFLDIQMDGMDGIATAHILRDQGYEGEIVFLTSYSEYVFDGYEVRALNYLVKPISCKKLSKCLNYVSSKLGQSVYNYHFKGTYLQIPYSKILYFTSANHYVHIVTADGSLKQLESLRNIINLLPSQFQYCHRTLIVNMDHVVKLKAKDLVLSNGVTVPVSTKYLQELRSSFISLPNNLL